MHYSDPHIEFCLENPDSIFRVLQLRDKETLARHIVKVIFRKGDHIYTEGEKSKSLLILAEGKYKISRVGVGGREQILKLMKPPDITGFKSLFMPALWTNNAVALEDTCICLPDRMSIMALLKHNHDFAFRMMDLMADEIIHYQERIISLTQKHVRGRIAETLLALCKTYGFESDDRTLNAILSRDDIAHYSNMTTSNAIRTLSNFASEGKLELRNKKIVILDLQSLKDISGNG